VTASRHLSKMFDTVWRLGPSNSPRHHPSHAAHGCMQQTIGGERRAGS
jgi:hypothetical protein